jgi:hypothetical protein
MKKTFLVFAIVSLLISCDNGGGMGNKNNKSNEPGYLTVTYLGNGNTSEDVPVDPKHYVVPKVDQGYMTVVEPETAVILGQGTLKKEGHTFNGWIYGGRHYYEGDSLSVGDNVNLKAVWY